ncbi:DNA/RNA non-specific endonuclease [Bacillus spongiae]|uniref:Serine protease n=1 Tax=Bacillus spongiae TaxID=2683610 RepID=A0ABU8HGM5_9BACI
MSIIHVNNSQRLNKELVAMQQQQALNRYMERSKEREQTVKDLQTKNPFEVGKPERVIFRKSRINPRNGLALERIIRKNDLFPISYLEAGLKAAKPICRIEVRDSIGRVLGYGTGFLVSPSLLLTNNHVLENEEAALFSLAQFNYELDLNYKERESKNFRFAPQRFFMTNQKLDFTLVAVDEVSGSGTHLSDFGYLPLKPQKGKALEGEHVSIVQHPSGAPKAIAIRENKITDIFEDFVHYETDTLEGSSGSAVFNDEWEVIALHHAGVRNPNDPSTFIANEGIRISSILQYIMEHYADLSDEQRKFLDYLSRGWEFTDKKREDILVEDLGLDWYKGTTGYDPKFLGSEYEVPHPTLRPDLEQDIALLKNGSKELDYTHFSIVMSKSRRLAFYTVVNIDGAKLIRLKREKKWHFDPRIDEKYQCGPELYKNNPLDRGHLVRRLDPVWGETAAKANKDTFHFTNCSPQHKHFNQKTWLDLEDYLLHHAENFNLTGTVFTGPIFRSDDMIYRGVQIPADFWKIAVIVKKGSGLSVTGYLQSQKNLINNLEFAYGKYKTFQVPIVRIEALTGLDFGNLRNHDPIGQLESTIGLVIDTFEDIIL